MSQPFFIMSDGQPVPSAGLPMTVYNLFHETPDVPDIIVYGHSRHQPEGPLLETVQDEAYALEFHSEEPGLARRIGRLAGMSQRMVQPQPRYLAQRIKELGLRRALIFGPGSDLLFYANDLLQQLDDVEATIYIVDDLRIPLRDSKNPVYRLSGLKTARRLLERCQRRFVITDEMAEHYREHYHLDFDVLPLPIPDQSYEEIEGEPILAPDESATSCQVFLAGTLGPLYDASLRSLARAFRSLATEYHLNPRLIVSGKTDLSEILALGFGTEQVTHLGWLPARADVLRQAARAHCTFVPYIFDPALEDFYRFSFPGKTSYYFVAGSPVVLQAPADSAVSRYFNRHGLDFVCDTLDHRSLAETLFRAIRLPADQRRALRDHYRSIIRQHHLASDARIRLLGQTDSIAAAANVAAA
ncbi:MAG: hypothetical protein IIC82_08345 [Chloroflexi bacterium]|nr:hypothetical protein [Chloroflexota bacterium]